MDIGIGGIIVAVITSGTLSTLITLLYNVWHDKKVRKDSLHEGLQALLYDRLKYLCKSYIKAGEISVNDLEDLQRMYNAYKKLGGNGFIDGLMNEVKKLKIIS